MSASFRRLKTAAVIVSVVWIHAFMNEFTAKDVHLTIEGVLTIWLFPDRS